MRDLGLARSLPRWRWWCRSWSRSAAGSSSRSPARGQLPRSCRSGSRRKRRTRSGAALRHARARRRRGSDDCGAHRDRGRCCVARVAPQDSPTADPGGRRWSAAVARGHRVQPSSLSASAWHSQRGVGGRRCRSGPRSWASSSQCLVWPQSSCSPRSRSPARDASRSEPTGMSASRTRFGREGQVCGRPKTRLVELGAIDSIANACAVNVTLGGRAIGAVGLTSLRGAIEPTVLEGRAPRSDDEVALGTETMRSLDAEVGRESPERAGRTIEYRVVGASRCRRSETRKRSPTVRCSPVRVSIRSTPRATSSGVRARRPVPRRRRRDDGGRAPGVTERDRHAGRARGESPQRPTRDRTAPADLAGPARAGFVPHDPRRGGGRAPPRDERAASAARPRSSSRSASAARGSPPQSGLRRRRSQGSARWSAWSQAVLSASRCGARQPQASGCFPMSRSRSPRSPASRSPRS